MAIIQYTPTKEFVMSLVKSTFRLLLLLLSVFSTLETFGQEADATADVATINGMLQRLETVFATGDIEAAMTAFTDDAIVFAENGADIVGGDAIRAVYTGMMTQFDVTLTFNTVEIEVADDMAYERGTYTLKLVDKASGQVATDATYRHIHILKRQADGSWRTWRMMVNTPPAPAA
jgi:uncharacterized protein (TIGR02246 family)